MAACALCGRRSPEISEALAACVDCIRVEPEEALGLTRAAHARTRCAFGLPASAPQSTGGVKCVLCAQECLIGEGERGYCGLRTARSGRLVQLAGTPRQGLLDWYRDRLPTNCVADRSEEHTSELQSLS